MRPVYWHLKTCNIGWNAFLLKMFSFFKTHLVNILDQWNKRKKWNKFFYFLGVWRRHVHVPIWKWTSLCFEDFYHENKTTSFSPTFKVSENKVFLFFIRGPQTKIKLFCYLMILNLNISLFQHTGSDYMHNNISKHS